MSEPSDFDELFRRVRAGDAEAAAELVKSYEPHIRRAVRINLRDPRLRRALDATDVCQSVLASFFVRSAAGQYELNSPEELVRLLMTMTRNKIATQARKQQVVRREEGDPARDDVGLPGREQSPSVQAMGRELFAQFRARLSDSERFLVDQRLLGRE